MTVATGGENVGVRGGKAGGGSMLDEVFPQIPQVPTNSVASVLGWIVGVLSLSLLGLSRVIYGGLREDVKEAKAGIKEAKDEIKGLITSRDECQEDRIKLTDRCIRLEGAVNSLQCEVDRLRK